MHAPLVPPGIATLLAALQSQGAEPAAEAEADEFAELLAAGMQALPSQPAAAPADAPTPELEPGPRDAGASREDPQLAYALAAFQQVVPRAAKVRETPETPAAPPRPLPVAAALAQAPTALAQAPTALAQAPAALAEAPTALAEAAAPQAPEAFEIHFHAAAKPAAFASTPPASVEIRTPVYAPAWGNEVAQTVRWMASERLQVAQLQLNPPDLGPVEIVLQLGGDGGNQASVAFAAQHADTRAALEAAIQRLRDMLGEAGIQLGQATVSAESFRERGGEARRERAPGDAPAAPAPAPQGAARSGSGLIDTFV